MGLIIAIQLIWLVLWVIHSLWLETKILEIHKKYMQEKDRRD